MKPLQVPIFWTLFVACRVDLSHGDRKGKSLLLPSKADFLRKEPANELGIQTKIIALVHRKVNQTTDEMLLNREYLHEDVYDSLMERCDTDQKERPFSWNSCVSNSYGLSAMVTGGVPEPKNKTITYLEVTFAPFKRLNDKGVEEICVLEETYKPKVYIVLYTYSHVPSNDTFPKNLDYVEQVHQHQLDKFGEHFLSIFGDKIEIDAIFNFGKDEYYDRDPPYECFLSIGSSQTVPVIEEKCDFFCSTTDKMSSDMLEELLMKARQEAEKEEELEETSHDEL